MAKYLVSGNKECGQSFKDVIDADKFVFESGFTVFMKGDIQVAAYDHYSCKRIMRKEDQ
jgi:hypothetical protein